jgi:uncharacterized protein (TIGR00251 family)
MIKKIFDTMKYTDAVSVSNNEILLKINVTTNASKSVFPTTYNPWKNCIEMSVKAIAKDNKANNEIIKILANYFNVKSKDICIKSGEKSKEKIIAIKNITQPMVYNKLKESVHELSSDS